MSANQFPNTIFVLGTARNVGKTVTSLGIIAKLLSKDYGYSLDDIGYIKPVGQETLTVRNGDGQYIQADKDAVVVTSLMKIRCTDYEIASPVVWRGGLTAAFIEQSQTSDPKEGRADFLQEICDAYRQVALGKRIVIVEGTGQPGVGSVAGISNADVINTLREMGVPVFVMLVAPAGIGSMIDQVFPYLMAMDHLGTQVDGLIVNGVYASKIDKIRRYLQSYYRDVFPKLYGPILVSQPVPPILGFVPSVPELRMPTMRLIKEHFMEDEDSSVEVVAPDDFDVRGDVLVRDMKVINLRYGYERYVEPGDAVVVGINANDSVLSVVMHHERLLNEGGKGFAGLILSCKSVGGLSRQVHDEVLGVENLPTISLDYDTADIIQRVERMTVKLQPYDIAKRELISDIYAEHLTFEQELPALPRAWEQISAI